MTELSDVRNRLDVLLKHPRAKTKAVRHILTAIWQTALEGDVTGASQRLAVVEQGVRERDEAIAAKRQQQADAEIARRETADAEIRRAAETEAEIARLSTVLGQKSVEQAVLALSSGKFEFAESEISRLQRFLEAQQIDKDGRALPMRWTGTWSELVEYAPGDVVELDGVAYVATSTTRSKPPSSDWDIIVRRGDTMQILGAIGGNGSSNIPGPTGPTGPAGATGPTGPPGTGGGGAGEAFAEDVGDGIESVFMITHGLGTRDVEVAVYRNDDFLEVLPDVIRTDPDTVTLDFGIEVPETDEYRVVVMAGGGGGGDPSTDTEAWMPLTTVVSGGPVLVWDDDDSLIPTLVPIS